MWAIMYTDNKLVEVDYTNAYEFDSYDKIGTFEEGKEILVDYWETQRDDSIRNIKEAKKLKKE